MRTRDADIKGIFPADRKAFTARDSLPSVVVVDLHICSGSALNAQHLPSGRESGTAEALACHKSRMFFAVDDQEKIIIILLNIDVDWTCIFSAECFMPRFMLDFCSQNFIIIHQELASLKCNEI